jgi:hypothetical protein
LICIQVIHRCRLLVITDDNLTAYPRLTIQTAALNATQILKRLRRSTPVALMLSPIGLLIVSAARLLIIADYNPTTALGVLSSQSYVNALLGTIVPLVPLFMPYAALLFLVANRVVLGLLALLAAALISPTNRSEVPHMLSAQWHSALGGGFFWHALLVVMAVTFVILLLVELAGVSPASFAGSVGVVASIVLLPLVVALYSVPIGNSAYVDLIRQPWLPAEAITPASNQEFIGYVLSSDGYWLEVLTANDRTIRYYRVSAIRDRQICQPPQTVQGRPLIALTSEQAPVPLCPSVQPAPEPVPGWVFHRGTGVAKACIGAGPICRPASLEVG